MINNTIVYEQPLTELIRVCLRIELLFQQIDYQIDDHSIFGSRNIITAIIDLLQILDRPDIKAKLAKELGQQMLLLNRLQHTPEIDQEKLQTLLKQLDELTRCFIDSSKKIGQQLREVELLNTLRLHLANPGGGCSFDVPVYHYWLNRPAEERHAILSTWFAEFDNVRRATSLILQLVRESAKSQQKTAEHGFYQELLDPQINLRLLRIAIPNHITAYPEISISRHYLSIRFFFPAIQERPSQYLQHLIFWISHCSS